MGFPSLRAAQKCPCRHLNIFARFSHHLVSIPRNKFCETRHTRWPSRGHELTLYVLHYCRNHRSRFGFCTCFVLFSLKETRTQLSYIRYSDVNERDGASNHRHFDCLLKRLFRRRSKKISKLRVTGLCEGSSPVTTEFPAHKGPVTRKMFLFDGVIMRRKPQYSSSFHKFWWS